MAGFPADYIAYYKVGGHLMLQSTKRLLVSVLAVIIAESAVKGISPPCKEDQKWKSIAKSGNPNHKKSMTLDL